MITCVCSLPTSAGGNVFQDTLCAKFGKKLQVLLEELPPVLWQ